jgi:hypothetical protein
MRRTATRTAIAIAVVAVCASGLAACGGSVDASESATTPTSTPTSKPTPELSTLSGRDEPDGPVLVIKLDNSRAALPHVGLTSADVVYVQQVEGGISRLAAVYSTRYPDRAAPIRSARETDTQLLPQYGEIPLAFSGSTADVHALVRKAGLIDVSADAGGKGYTRMSDRWAPHNLAGDPKVLLKRAGKRPPVKDVGFRFGKAPEAGKAVTSATATMPAARVAFAYNAKTKRYAVSLDGIKDTTQAEGQVAASTVIIQSVPVSMLKRRDTSGAQVPFTSTVGKGKAVVLRDGKAWNVSWSRPSKSKGTRWIYQGEDFPLRPGQVWVVLLDEDRRPTLR